MKFEQFQLLMGKTFGDFNEAGAPVAQFPEIDPQKLHPLVLAYIGDAYFNLYVRTRMLNFEQTKVRILHNYGARMVSATWQAFALRKLESELLKNELDIVRRGRNAKSNVPKSASVADYRYSTGFEALLGYLYLTKNEARLNKLVEQAFVIITREISNSKENDGEEK